MSLTQHQLSAFPEVRGLIGKLNETDDDVYLLFTASRGPNGTRWCPDCVKAEPIVDSFLKKLPLKKNAHLITVELEKNYLRDSTNPYYTSEDFQLRKVPTLMRWNGDKKLEEEDCMCEKKLSTLFN